MNRRGFLRNLFIGVGATMLPKPKPRLLTDGTDLTAADREFLTLSTRAYRFFAASMIDGLIARDVQ